MPGDPALRPLPTPPLSPDTPPPPGVHCVRDAEGRVVGVDVAVVAPDASRVELCLPTAGGERRVHLRHRVHGTWFDRVPGVGPGDRYHLRADGPWEPVDGQRHNPAKALVDPYARALDGTVDWAPEVFGHVVDDAFAGDGWERDDRDSAPFVPHAVVADLALDASGRRWDWQGDRHPRVPWSDTVLYECHVKGITRLHPDVPEALRGTYAGLGHPAMTRHLRSLGVTSVELLPIHADAAEPHLVRQGLTNYWGYNTLGFFAPNPEYAAASDPLEVVDEVRAMVRSLHAAGLEVILDVVYNHTCEQSSWTGSTLSLRGLGNSTFYRLDGNGSDIDVTGCGNTLDFGNPAVVQLTLDSLRHWVTEYHVDGFRFDLAPALARGADGGFDCFHPLLVALRTDPVLSRVKLIAEPWDLGRDGWRTGQFPPPFSEWNDHFRDASRSFWVKALHERTGRGVRDLATRLSGSSDLFAHDDRMPTASINFITAHDGFTLHDLTAYDRKHNEANGEQNRDGTDNNRSWNHGAEGDTEDATVLAARRRTMRNLLGTLLLSMGVPMLVGGDEIGRTQGGNNNPYSRDDETSWVDWSLADWQRDLLATTQHLLRLRRELPVLAHHSFFPSTPAPDDGVPTLTWLSRSGETMTGDLWASSDTHTLGMLLEPERPAAEDERGGTVLLLCHNRHETVEFVLPTTARGREFALVWCSSWESPDSSESGQGARVAVGTAVTLEGPTMRLYRLD